MCRSVVSVHGLCCTTTTTNTIVSDVGTLATSVCCWGVVWSVVRSVRSALCLQFMQILCLHATGGRVSARSTTPTLRRRVVHCAQNERSVP